MRAIFFSFLLLCGCAFGDGAHFAELSPRLTAALEVPGDRDLGEGWQKLASDYEVRVDRFELEASAVALLDTGGGTAEFDPANPPPGYSLCHNGHCHADDGRLVDYEEIAAELAEGGGAAPIVVLPVGGIDLLAGVSRDLECVPACGLPRAELGLASLEITQIELEGAVRDGREPPRIEGERAFAFEAAFGEGEGLSLGAEVDLPADRAHDPDVTFTVIFDPTVAILDPVDFAALPVKASRYDLSAEPGARETILSEVAELDLGIEIRR